MLVLLVLSAVFGITHGSLGSLDPGKPDIEEAKGFSDGNIYTRDEYMACYPIVNCDLGPDVTERSNLCFDKLKPEEQREYTQMLLDFPATNFSTPDIRIITKEYCPLGEEEKAGLDQYFIDHMAKRFEEVCSYRASSQCLRLYRAWRCIQAVMDEKFDTGDCKRLQMEIS